MDSDSRYIQEVESSGLSDTAYVGVERKQFLGLRSGLLGGKMLPCYCNRRLGCRWGRLYLTGFSSEPRPFGLSVTRGSSICIFMRVCVCPAGYQQGLLAPLEKEWLWLVLKNPGCVRHWAEY